MFDVKTARMTDIDVNDIIAVRYIPEIEIYVYFRTARVTEIDVMDIIVVRYMLEIAIYV